MMLSGTSVTIALMQITMNLMIVSEQTTIQIRFQVSILWMLVERKIRLEEKQNERLNQTE